VEAASAEHAREFVSRFHGCHCRLVVTVERAKVCWDPSPDHLSRRDRKHVSAQFRPWRNSCLKQFAKERGLSVRFLAHEVVKLVPPGTADAEIEVAPEYPITVDLLAVPGRSPP
jgi:hypothetical protein